MLMLAAAESSAFAKESESPDACQTDDSVDEASEPCRVPVGEPSDEIELEKSPQAPIQGTDQD